MTAENFEMMALRAAYEQGIQLQNACGCSECRKRDEPKIVNFAKALRDEMVKQMPVSHEYQDREGNWKPFINNRHYENTVADGSWPIRALFTIPPDQSARVAELEKDAMRYRWCSENPDRAESVFQNLGPSYFDKEIDMFMKEAIASVKESK